MSDEVLLDALAPFADLPLQGAIRYAVGFFAVSLSVLVGLKLTRVTLLIALAKTGQSSFLNTLIRIFIAFVPENGWHSNKARQIQSKSSVFTADHEHLSDKAEASFLGAHALFNCTIAALLGVIVALPITPMFRSRLGLALVAVSIFRFMIPLTVALTELIRDTMTRLDIHDPMGASFQSVSVAIRGCMWLATAVLSLNALGYDTDRLLTSLSLGGVVLGLALQDSLRDVAAFGALLADTPFRVGDDVALNDGKRGIVTRIGFRSTSVSLECGQIMHIPNSQLASQGVQNFSQTQRRRTAFSLHLPLTVSPQLLDRVPQLVAKAADMASGSIEFDGCHIVSVAATIEYYVVWHVVGKDVAGSYKDTNHAAFLRLLRNLRRSNIPLTLPAQSRLLVNASAQPTAAAAAAAAAAGGKALPVLATAAAAAAAGVGSPAVPLTPPIAPKLTPRQQRANSGGGGGNRRFGGTPNSNSGGSGGGGRFNARDRGNSQGGGGGGGGGGGNSGGRARGNSKNKQRGGNNSSWKKGGAGGGNSNQGKQGGGVGGGSASGRSTPERARLTTSVSTPSTFGAGGRGGSGSSSGGGGAPALDPVLASLVSATSGGSSSPRWADMMDD